MIHLLLQFYKETVHSLDSTAILSTTVVATFKHEALSPRIFSITISQSEPMGIPVFLMLNMGLLQLGHKQIIFLKADVDVLPLLLPFFTSPCPS